MAANKNVRFGPIQLTNTYATNILNTAVTSMAGPIGMTIAQPYMIIKHLRITNVAGAATTFRLFIGLTAGVLIATSFMGYDTNVPVGSYVDWYGAVRLDSTDFLSGGASITLQLTIQGEGELGISG